MRPTGGPACRTPRRGHRGTMRKRSADGRARTEEPGGPVGHHRTERWADRGRRPRG
ncbi:predicted protein [Streptomyces viridosporus ATCC 14672]|uniref:Predicted protein n=1 Tax=Streptomyces viridosporus (strain ATCC 14672 / DSM 40746 / JCM 4963 / KCTC 9882 / NRRL B-12104 / FH 1290) TaxID=566461 RepID=D5ZZW8_STRV1|nr:predicted protein [Streptomyces viridosporus ATCC 14672]